MRFKNNLFEEEFNLMYHLRQGYKDIQKMVVFERKWLIDRFIEQKQKEQEAMKGSNKASAPQGMSPAMRKKMKSSVFPPSK